MNLQHERISLLCERLKLERVAADWSPLAQAAANEQASFGDFLERVLTAEADAREDRKRTICSAIDFVSIPCQHFQARS